MQPRRKPSGSRFTNLPPTPENTGALSNDTGHLDVGWGTEGETFTMSWTQRGRRILPSHRGFGARQLPPQRCRCSLELISLARPTGSLRNGFDTRTVLAGFEKFDQPLPWN
jgi:hypothetical protein